VGTLLGVAPYRVMVKDVIPGSVIVQFTVAPHSTTGVSLSTAVVLATFGSAGVAVAGVPTLASVSGVFSEVPPSPAAPSDGAAGDGGGVKAWAVAVLAIGGVLVLLVLCLCLRNLTRPRKREMVKGAPATSVDALPMPQMPHGSALLPPAEIRSPPQADADSLHGQVQMLQRQLREMDEAQRRAAPVVTDAAYVTAVPMVHPLGNLHHV
jgi:hypothetical protein